MAEHPRIIVALDRSSKDDILSLADRLSGIVGMMKVGLQAFTANGPSIVSELRDRQIDVFLDLKFHDIPNTVLHAVQEAVELGVSLLTVHTSGGGAMLRAAVEGARGSSTRILGVTVLTSHDETSLSEIGIGSDVPETVLKLATLGSRNGIDGVVASPREVRFLRDHLGENLIIVTPGIRAVGEASGDQKRTMSAAEALKAGADYLVIGRPITEASDPADAARSVLRDSGTHGPAGGEA